MLHRAPSNTNTIDPSFIHLYSGLLQVHVLLVLSWKRKMNLKKQQAYKRLINLVILIKSKKK